MNNLMSASGLERSLNLAGIWPVNLQYLIPKTGALSTNKLFCGALFRCQDPCRRAPFRFCAFGSMGGNWEDEVFRHARHFHALSVARTAVHGNRNHHQSSQLTHAASHLFLTCLYTCSGPDRLDPILTQRGRGEHLFWIHHGIHTQSPPPDFGLSD